MPGKRDKPEEIIAKLRQVDVLCRRVKALLRPFDQLA